jgi:hypothetical protein
MRLGQLRGQSESAVGHRLRRGGNSLNQMQLSALPRAKQHTFREKRQARCRVHVDSTIVNSVNSSIERPSDSVLPWGDRVTALDDSGLAKPRGINPKTWTTRQLAQSFAAPSAPKPITPGHCRKQPCPTCRNGSVESATFFSSHTQIRVRYDNFVAIDDSVHEFAEFRVWEMMQQPRKIDYKNDYKTLQNPSKSTKVAVVFRERIFFKNKLVKNPSHSFGIRRKRTHNP